MRATQGLGRGFGRGLGRCAPYGIFKTEAQAIVAGVGAICASLQEKNVDGLCKMMRVMCSAAGHVYSAADSILPELEANQFNIDPVQRPARPPISHKP